MQTTQRPEAILVGSLGVLADTFELERLAFNRAFEALELPWEWGPRVYQRLAELGPSSARLDAWAKETSTPVQVQHVLAEARTRFRDILAAVDLPLRSGVAETLTRAHEADIPIALVTDMTTGTIDRLLQAVYPPIGRADFATVISGDLPAHSPTHLLALSQLGVEPGRAVTIEEAPEAAKSARAMGLRVVCIPAAAYRESEFPGDCVTQRALSAETLGLADTLVAHHDATTSH